MEERVEKYKQLLREALLREENFKKTLIKIRAGYANDKGDRWMNDVANEALEKPKKGGELR